MAEDVENIEKACGLHLRDLLAIPERDILVWRFGRVFATMGFGSWMPGFSIGRPMLPGISRLDTHKRQDRTRTLNRSLHHSHSF